MSSVRKSTPATSRPIARAARSAISRLSGWMTSVTSTAVPPVERLAGRAQEDDSRPAAARCRGRSPLCQQPLRLVVELEAGQHLLVADAAPGIGVDLLDQLFDGAAAVTDDVSRHPLRGGDQLAVDHQQAVIEPSMKLSTRLVRLCSRACS